MTVTVIAEIGVNHQNDLDTAKALIIEAKRVGADMAKFQASIPHMEVSRFHAPEHYEFIRNLVPSNGFLALCAAYCAEVGIEFLCTPDEEGSLKTILDLGVKSIKVGSDNITNLPFLVAVADTNLPVILSTGMATYAEIEMAVSHFQPGKLTLLHCVSAYPCPASQANVSAVGTLRERFPKIEAVGYSDHTTSVTLPILAMGYGAEVIEKHLTLSHKMPGPDHMASLIPLQFGAMVKAIREAEVAIGNGGKTVQPVEEKNRTEMRKSIVASRAIVTGEFFGRDNLAVKRPGGGMSPTQFYRLIEGQRAQRDYQEDEQI